MINLIFQYFIGQIVTLIFILFGFKYVMKKKCNIEINYIKYSKWFYTTVKECFASMFETINKYKK